MITPSPMLHHFTGDGHPYIQGALTADDLRRFLDRLGTFRIMQAHDYEAAARDGSLQPGEICLTFDDALKSQSDIAAPVLAERGLTAFFFVYSQPFVAPSPVSFEVQRYFRNRHFKTPEQFYPEFYSTARKAGLSAAVDRALTTEEAQSWLAEYSFYSEGDRRFRFFRDQLVTPEVYAELMIEMLAAHSVDVTALAREIWMTDEDLRTLADAGHCIGLHSYSHPTTLGSLPPGVQEEEYRANARHLTDVLGARPSVMSHPSNSYSAHTLKILQDLGVTVGFRSNATMKDPWNLELPRLDHLEFTAKTGAAYAA